MIGWSVATTRERVFKRALVEQVRARSGARLLDLGCGTGTLTVQLARAHAEAHVLGVDADAEALAIAARKVGETGAAGELHVADWGRPGNALSAAGFLLVRLLDEFEATRDNAAGTLPRLIEEAGVGEVRETRSFATFLGTIRLYRAT